MRILVFFILFTFQSLAMNDTLYINRANAPMLSYTANICSINTSENFELKNGLLDYAINDVIDFVLINNDNQTHDVWLTDGTVMGSVGAMDTINFSKTFSALGTYALSLSDFIGNSLGAACIIRVGLQNEQKFAWNLWDVNADLSLEIANQTTTSIPSDYKPNLCTINRQSYPNTTSDPEGAVTGNVDDTIYISIVNGGNMVHTLHFHGYHIFIVQATVKNDIVGWTKDSLPIFPNEAMTVRLVPDKEGMYPVHDHNLINVLNNGNTYPGGMITQLNIQP